VFKDFTPQRDATIVTRLKKAGAVIVAKTTMGEYASGYLGSAFGVVRNACDPTRSASGSSGGTGTGIAANFATVGIGEDTGGSIRGPASVSNLVGLRPTLPLVSRFGMMPARPTTDTLGPIARSVKDAAIVLDLRRPRPHRAASRAIDDGYPYWPAAVLFMAAGFSVSFCSRQFRSSAT
jgi:Asp-tRNA(Asn)/Glu-tRNA(Gln) amidotransferase A subunit family amidase